MRRRIILRRSQFDASGNYRIFRSELRAGSPGATPSETLFSSFVIKPACVLDQSPKIPSDDTLNQPIMLRTRTSWGCMSTVDWSALCVFKSAVRQLLTSRPFELFPHAFEPILRDNKTVVDMGGVAGDGQLARSYVWLPYIVLRPWILAADPRLSRRYNPRVSSTRLLRDNRRGVFFARVDCSLHRSTERFVHLFLDRTYRHFFDN